MALTSGFYSNAATGQWTSVYAQTEFSIVSGNTINDNTIATETLGIPFVVMVDPKVEESNCKISGVLNGVKFESVTLEGDLNSRSIIGYGINAITEIGETAELTYTLTCDDFSKTVDDVIRPTSFASNFESVLFWNHPSHAPDADLHAMIFQNVQPSAPMAITSVVVDTNAIKPAPSSCHTIITVGITGEPSTWLEEYGNITEFPFYGFSDSHFKASAYKPDMEVKSWFTFNCREEHEITTELITRVPAEYFDVQEATERI